MRVLVAPDSFTGTLSAAEAAEAIAAGWRREAAEDVLDIAPVSDGGPGFVGAMVTALDAERRVVAVRGPLGDEVLAEFAVDHATKTAYVESASACGLHLIPAERRDPVRATSFGLGQVLVAVLETEVSRIVIGLGGTAICDGGAGMLAALGLTARDDAGDDVTHLLSDGGGALAKVGTIDLPAIRERMAGVRLVVASDVDSPLTGTRGAARGFAPQKGAHAEDLEVLESALTRWGHALGRVDIEGTPKEVMVLLGAGAGGGIGAALLALGATRVAGIDIVIDVLHLSQRAARADLVITGEGSFDWQSLRGKAVTGVAGAALAEGRPVVVLAGRVEVGRREWSGIGVTGVYSVAEVAGSESESVSRAGHWLEECAARAARSWSRGSRMRG